jgi:hypothetical protein
MAWNFRQQTIGELPDVFLGSSLADERNVAGGR